MAKINSVLGGDVRGSSQMIGVGHALPTESTGNGNS